MGIPNQDPEAEGAHTQLGQKDGRNGKYDQGREFDANGKPVKDIDFTDHGRPQNHPNPHQHPYIPNPTGGTPKHAQQSADYENATTAAAATKGGRAMSILTIPMFWREGNYVQLQALLAFINQLDLVWTIIEFDGVGIMPAGMSYAEFQTILRQSKTGYVLNWQDLLLFAENIEYTVDCLIVAVKDINALTGPNFLQMILAHVPLHLGRLTAQSGYWVGIMPLL